MRKTLRFYSFFAMMFLMLVAGAGCSKYEEVGLGVSNVVSKGATFRSEGGGVEDKVQFAGTWKTASFSMEYEAIPINFTPRTISINNLPIVMTNMKNQEMKFTPSLTYMLNPPNVSKLFKNFKAYEHEINSFFRESCLRVLAPLDLGLDIDVYDKVKSGKIKDSSISFDDRQKVSRMILQDFLRNFGSKYGDFMDCFVFIDVAMGNVDYPGDILAKMEEAVGKQYEADALIYEGQVKDLEGKIQVAASEADLEAYDTEAGALTPDVMAYLGNDMVDDFIKNPNIDTEIWIPMENDGTISWFK